LLIVEINKEIITEFLIKSKREVKRKEKERKAFPSSRDHALSIGFQNPSNVARCLHLPSSTLSNGRRWV